MTFEMKMSDFSPDTKAIFELVFVSQRYSLALACMDEIGDTESALLIERVQRRLAAEKVVEGVSAPVFVMACTAMLETFDDRRESRDKKRQWQLRHTIESIFELRSVARKLSGDSTIQVAVVEPTKANIADIHLKSMPVPSAHVGKLAKAGIETLGDFEQSDFLLLQTQTGLAEKQLNDIRRKLGMYLLGQIPVESLVRKEHGLRLSKSVVTLAHLFEEIANQAEAHWKEQQIADLPWRNTMAQRDKLEAKVRASSFDFWQIGVTLFSSEKPVLAGSPLRVRGFENSKLIESATLWSLLLEAGIASWNPKKYAASVVPSEIKLSQFIKLAEDAKTKK